MWLDELVRSKDADSAKRENDARKRGRGRKSTVKGNDDDNDGGMDDEARTSHESRERKRAEDARTARFLRASALKREVNSSLAKF